MQSLSLVAPGTELRAGLERVLQASAGLLLVVGDDAQVLSICTGGFLLDAPFSPQKLSELAKMDGAIILSHDAKRIARANVHLMPNASVPTSETGTRHRTAERTARTVASPVISISEEMGVISLYYGKTKTQIESVISVRTRADQALSALERYVARLVDVMGQLLKHEVRATVTLRDVCGVIHRAEMAQRIVGEIEGMILQLGTEGRLVALQLDELRGGLGNSLGLVIRDYASEPTADFVDAALLRLSKVREKNLQDPETIVEILGLARVDIDDAIEPRGFRFLAEANRLPSIVSERVVAQLHSLSQLLAASHADLVALEGIGDSRARAVRDAVKSVREQLG